MKFVIFVSLLAAAGSGGRAAQGFMSDFLSSLYNFNNSTSDRTGPVVEPLAKCNVQLSDFNYKQPVILNGINLWKQYGPNLNFTGKITLACPGGKNVLDGTNDRIVKATCSGGRLRYSGKSYLPGNVTCKTSVTGDVRTEKKTCGSGSGTWSIIGFDLRNGTFVDLFRVCYSQEKGDSIYSHHTLSGRSIKYKQIESLRPGFKSAGSASGVSPATAYKITSQLETMTKLLGKSQAEKYIDAKKGQILARGHLSPDADFPMVPLQFATYFYINVCPQWQTVNAGNWLKIESMVRELASSRSDDLEIYTGVHGILTLPDQNNNNREIYLADDRKISVPEYLWKVVYHRRRKEGIALVTLNNPYADKAPRSMCTNICNESNWIHDGFTNFAKGYTYCCGVNDLRTTVSTIPSLSVKKILNYEKS